MSVGAARAFLVHIRDPRRLKRMRGDLVEVLTEPLRDLAQFRPLVELAGKPFVWRFPGDNKILGDIDSEGMIVPKTFYGPGNPVDRRRFNVELNGILR